MSAVRTSSRQIAQSLLADGLMSAELIGPADALITDVASLDAAEPTDLAFCESDAVEAASQSQAGCLIIRESVADAFAASCPEKALLPCGDPQAAFIAVMTRLRPARPQPAPKIALDCYISPTARIGQDCHVGPNASIGADVRIGDRTIIHPGAYIADGTVIGEDCIVGPGAVVHHDCLIGDRCVLDANCVIGADGFGFRFVAGRYERIPHTGRVRIEDDCEVGACATVDRGMIEDTVLGQGTKIDNLVVIAHNCRLGPHNAAAGMVGLAGSVTTGAYVRFGGHAGIGDHVAIGEGATIGAKAGVMTDIPAGATYHGAPARPGKEAMRQFSMIRKLPEIRDQIKAMRRQIDALQAIADAGSHAEPKAKAA